MGLHVDLAHALAERSVDRGDTALPPFALLLNAVQQQRERWKRAVSAVNGALGDAVGELYVAKHFQPKAKQEMDRLVENLRKGYAARIQQVDWMTADTKKARWRSSPLSVRRSAPVKWKTMHPRDRRGRSPRQRAAARRSGSTST